MSENKNDLQTQVREWLLREGYPFEMKVAQVFARAGFAIQQSDYYDDPETGVPREVDVFARLQRSTPNGLVFRVEFLIECKSSLDKPWLLLCRETRGLPEEGRVAQRISSRVGIHVLVGLAADPTVQSLELFRLREPIAYGLKQAFLKDKKEKDGAYAAMNSIASAAKAAAKHWTQHPYEPRIVEFIFPVIIIDGRLFRCWLDEAAVLSVSEASCGTLLWRTPFGHLSHIIVDVQTAASIEEFAVESYQSARALLENYYEKVQSLIKVSTVALPIRET